MNSDVEVKLEEDPVSRTEPEVSCRFFILCYSFIKLVIDILNHISIVVLQDVESEVNLETEENKDIDIKHEQDVTFGLLCVVEIEKKVKDSVFLCIFTSDSPRWLRW